MTHQKKEKPPKKTKKQPANCKKEFRTSDRLKNNLYIYIYIYIYREYLQNSKIVVENQIKDIKRQFKKDDYQQPINSLPLKKILDI